MLLSSGLCDCVVSQEPWAHRGSTACSSETIYQTHSKCGGRKVTTRFRTTYTLLYLTYKKWRKVGNTTDGVRSQSHSTAGRTSFSRSTWTRPREVLVDVWLAGYKGRTFCVASINRSEDTFFIQYSYCTMALRQEATNLSVLVDVKSRTM